MTGCYKVHKWTSPRCTCQFEKNIFWN